MTLMKDAKLLLLATIVTLVLVLYVRPERHQHHLPPASSSPSTIARLRRQSLYATTSASTNSDNVTLVIYLFDTKVHAAHPMLRDYLVPTDGDDQEFGEYPFQPANHGTFVASVVVRNLSSSSSSQVRVVPLAIIDGNNGKGSGSSRLVLNAMHYAVEHRRRVSPQANALAVWAVARLSPKEEEQQAKTGSSQIWPFATTAAASSWWPPQWWWLDHWRPNSFDAALTLGSANGFAIITAAGNHGSRATCMNSLPRQVVVVGALEEAQQEKRRRRAAYSNFGPCVSAFATGTATGAAAGDNGMTQSMTGTSVAAALVANRAAQAWLQRPSQSAADVLAGLYDDEETATDMQCHLVTSSADDREACETATTTAAQRVV